MVSVTSNRLVGIERWPYGGFSNIPSPTLIRFRFNIRNSSDNKAASITIKTTKKISTNNNNNSNKNKKKKNSFVKTVITDETDKCEPISVRSLTQNGDPLGRKDLGKCVVKWISLGMKAMAIDFGEAELQGEFGEVRQRMGPGLTFVIQAQPYLSGVPMPSGLESVCLKACTHYPTLFDHFQRELRDVVKELQGKGLVDDWQKTESWMLLKELAKSGCCLLFTCLDL